MELFQWLSLFGIPGVILFIFTFILKRALRKRDAKQEEIRLQNERLDAQNKATQLGVQALLRDRLLQAFRFFIQQGYADYGDRDNVKNMYVQYEALGPNSVMDDLYSKFIALPMQPDMA